MIRPAAASDAGPAGALLSASAGPLAGPIWGNGDQALAERRFTEVFVSRRGYTSHDVAVANGAVVGLIGHLPHGGGRGAELRTLAGTLRVYGLPGTLGLLWRMRPLGEARPQPDPNAYHVWSLAVVEGYRRRGIGTALLRHAQRKARQSGAACVGLDVLIDNVGAIRFYKREGYTERRRRESDRLRRMTGSSGLIYMTRPVDPAD